MMLSASKLCRGLGFLLMVIAGVLISSCGGAGSASGDNPAFAVNPLVIEPLSEIPQPDGREITTGVYVHNYSDLAISAIRYTSLAINGNQRVTVISPHNCSELAAHTSCLLPVKVPALVGAAAGSSLVVADFAGGQSRQLLNYRYVATAQLRGVNFGGNLKLTASTNQDGQYATVFVFAGNHQAIKQVGFYSDNRSLSYVSASAAGGRLDLAADSVVPLELHLSPNPASNSIALRAVVAGQNSGRLLNQNLAADGNVLQVSIVPTQQANLLMSNLPPLNALTESSITLTILNNGASAATQLSLVSSSSDVAVATAAVNSCAITLAVGDSCNFKLNLQNFTTSGSALITLNYVDGIGSTSAEQAVYINNSPVYPLITVPRPASAVSSFIYESSGFNFIISNNGTAALESLNFALKTPAALSDVAFTTTNNCNGVIASGRSCNVTIHFVAGSTAASGFIYLQTSGVANGNNYNFAGLSLKFEVSLLAAYITDTSGHNIYRCLINRDGSVRNCLATNGTAGGSLWTPYNISGNAGGYVYVTNDQNGGNGAVYRCNLNPDGSLQTCVISNGGISSNMQPTGIMLENGFIYVLDYQNVAVNRCNLESAGMLGGCAPTGSGLTSGLNAALYNIAFNNGYAYITDSFYDNIYFVGESSNGTLGSFTLAQNGISANGITFRLAANGVTYAYIASLGTLDNHVYQCAIAANGALVNCGNALAGGEPNNWQPSALAFYGNNAYVTDEGNNKLAICPLNSNGSFASCSESAFGAGSWMPHSITIFQYLGN